MGVGDTAQVYLMLELDIVCLSHQAMESKDVDVKDVLNKENKESNRSDKSGWLGDV